MSETGTPAQKTSSNGTVIVVLILLFAIGVGIWWAFGRVRPVDSAEQVQPAAVRTVFPLESFTVNLADQEEGRFLRATLSLGVNGEIPTLAKGENKTLETGRVSIATIRDSIIAVLAQYKSDELLTSDGKSKLKADLIRALNRDVPALGVQQIYFTEFLVQR